MQKSKLLSILLALVMVLGILPAGLVSAGSSKYEESKDDTTTAEGWTISARAIDGDWDLDNSTAYTGEVSLRLSNQTGFASNHYMRVWQEIPVQVGKSYRYTIAIKVKNASTVYTMLNWILPTKTTLLPMGATADWQLYEFDYVHSDANLQSVQLGVFLDDKTEAVWLDNITCYEVKNGVRIGENMIRNSSFEKEKVTLSTDTAVADTASMQLEEVYQTVKGAKSFRSEDMNSVLAGFQFAPVFPAENFTVDGSLEEWDREKYPTLLLPTMSAQYTGYIDGAPRDVTATVQYAYDDTFFYLGVDVTDDKHVHLDDVDTYWQADSIQLDFGREQDSFGAEIGLSYNDDTNESVWYSKDVSDEDLDVKVDLKCSRNGEHTIYELALPWSLKFGGGLDHSALIIPETFPFNMLINDNDGDGRAYCIEIAPGGISVNKTNENSPRLHPLQTGQDWYVWMEGKRKADSGVSADYNMFLVNNSNQDKTFTISDVDLETSEEVVLPAGEGVCRQVTRTFEEAGDYEIKIALSDGESTDQITFAVAVSPTEEEALRTVANLRKKMVELGALLEECGEKGINTDYQELAYHTMEVFIPLMEEDISNQDLARIVYNDNALSGLYTRAKQQLQDFQEGKGNGLDAPMYLSGKTSIDGQSIIGEVEYNDGTIVRQPVFLRGYGHDLGELTPYLPHFTDYGVNATQLELGPRQWMTNLPSWSLNIRNKPKAVAGVTDEDAANGEYSFHVDYDSLTTANQYITLTQGAQVKPNTTYKFGMWIKGTVESNGVWYSLNGWSDIARVGQGKYDDWTKVEAEFTTGPDVTALSFMLYVDSVADIYADDFFLYQADDAKQRNQLINGDWEEGDVEGYFPDVNATSFQRIKKALEVCEENNVAVSLLLSPHYMIDSVLEEYADDGIRYPAYGMIKYNVDHPVVREILERHIRALIEEVRDYSCINNICLTNEPRYDITSMPDFYKEEWEDYLREIYDNDINKLNEAYGTDYTTFDGVSMRTYNTDPKDARMYDSNMFGKRVFAAFHKWMADIVHEVAPELPVTTKQQAAAIGRADRVPRTFVWQSVDSPVMISQFTDINGNDGGTFMDENRDGTGDDGPFAAYEWYDLQLGAKLAPVANMEHHIVKDFSEDFVPEEVAHFDTELWQGALHGMAFSTIWTIGRTVNAANWYWGNILYRPDCFYEVGKTSMDLNRLANEVTALQKKPADVAVLYSEASRNYDTAYLNYVYTAYTASLFNGVRVKFVHEGEGQIEKMQDVDILIVPGANAVFDSTVQEIDRFVKNGGKVVTIGDADSVLGYDEHHVARASLGEELANIRSHAKHIPAVSDEYWVTSPVENDLRQMLEEVFKESDLMDVVVVDAETGKTVDGIEWSSVAYEGGTLINLFNSIWASSPTVNVYVNGEKVTDAHELRSETDIGESWELKPYEPILIKTALTTEEGGGQQKPTTPDEDDKDDTNNNSSGSGSGGGHSSGGSGGGGGKGAIGWGGGVSAGNSGSTSGTAAPQDTPAAPAAPAALPDTVGHWAQAYIAELQGKGVLSGYEDGYFYPERNVTRAEFAKIMAQALGIAADESGENLFTDVPAGEWYQPWVNAMNKAGLITGYGDTFGPDDMITREDMATILYRTLIYKNIALSGTSSFADSAEIADYAAEAVGTLAENGVLNGFDGKFLPKDNATRAEAAAMVSRVLSMIG